MGKKSRKFVILEHMLRAKLVVLRSEKFPLNHTCQDGQKLVVLEDEDADIFNLFVMWLHGYALPRVNSAAHKPSTTHIMQTAVPALKNEKMISLGSRQLSASFAPTYTPDPHQVGANDCHFHISSQNDFKTYSPEELRLAFREFQFGNQEVSPQQTAPFVPAPNHGSLGIEPAAPPANTTAGSDDTSKDDKADNEATQIALLRLALFAEKHNVTTCINDAHTNYYAGEGVLGRSHFDPVHIDLVYQSKRHGSPLQRLIADDAFRRSLTRTTSVYREAFQRNPLFLEHFLDRLDGKVQVFGCTMRHTGGKPTSQ